MANLQNKLKPIAKHTECIILIHGLARTSRSMKKAEKAFSSYGYKVINIDYPSRTSDIAQLTQDYIHPCIKQCESKNYQKIHFLTHSMGGILLRYYFSSQHLTNIGRTVMLAPPNQGSEIVDKLGHLKLFQFLNGPAGSQLGTTKNSIPNQLGNINFETGIISGNKTVNPLLSLLISGENDGKVAVESAKTQGMKEFLLVPNNHSFIMQKTQVIQQSLYFIQNGFFA